MYVCGEKNITFLHIPKTAGTSMLDWLESNKGDSSITKWDVHPKHTSIVKNKIPNFSFTVVRNPWDRAVSMYFYMKTIAAVHEESKWLKLNKITKENFPPFSNWLFNLKDFQNPHDFWFDGLSEQVEWLDAPVDLIIRYEDLNKEFIKIQTSYNCFAPLPMLYVSKRDRDYKQYYNDSTKKFISQTFEKDIEILKYQF